MVHRHWLLALAIALAAFAPGGRAHAEAVTLVSASYVVGTATSVQSDALALAGPGRLEVTLTDLQWPQALAELSFSVVDASGTSFGSGGAGPPLAFELAAGSYFLLTSARAPAVAPGTPWGTGRYGVLATFTLSAPAEIPLPPAIALLVSGLAGLFAMRRRTTIVSPAAIRV